MPPFPENDLRRREAFIFPNILPVSLEVKDQDEVILPAPVIEITEVTDRLEPFRKYMEQEAFYKLQWSNGNGP